MFVILLCLFLSAAVAVLCAVLLQLSTWLCVAVFAGVFLLLHLLYLLILYAFSLGVDTGKPIKRQNPVCRAGCASAIGALCAYCGIVPHISGVEKLPSDSRFLLVCNHRSFFDPLIIMDRLRKYNISFISKPSNMRIPIAGRVAYAAGFLPIDRENNREALKTIITASEYLKNDICSMAVYPEGTRSRDGKLLPFHAGCFKVAQRAGVPLVIACVYGTENAKKHLFFSRNHAYLDILEVMPADDVKRRGTHELAEYSAAVIQDALKKAEEKP